MKKFVIYFFGILILAFLAFAGTWYFFNNLTDKPIIKPENKSISKALQNFFPEGTARETATGTDQIESGPVEMADVGTSSAIIPVSAKFQQLSPNMISGASIISTNSGTSSLWYMEKATGHIYSVNYVTGESEKISNTTMPAVGEIYWGKNSIGPIFLLRYLKNSATENLLGRLKFTSDGGQIEGTTVTNNISSFAVSPRRDRYFYISTDNGSSKGYIGSFSGGTKIKRFGNKR